MTRENIKDKLKGFETDFSSAEEGILLYIPELNQFCAISFGDGTNSDSLEEGCDDYIYIACYEYVCGDFEEFDGGQLDYNTEEENYNGDITNAVYDALNFMYDDVPDFIPLHTF